MLKAVLVTSLYYMQILSVKNFEKSQLININIKALLKYKLNIVRILYYQRNHYNIASKSVEEILQMTNK